MPYSANRKIIHVDMDAFFAAVEQRDAPELKGKPVVVGGTAEGRGVVATASYEARKFGVRSAMSAARAKVLCPQAIFVRPNFERYREVSRQVRDIFEKVTQKIEPLSLDEAYLDVTENRLGNQHATEVAKYIKAQIRSQTGLSASAGVSYNKLIAKIASDYRKPDGLTVVAPGHAAEFLDPQSVSVIPGIGPRAREKLVALGIDRISQLREMGEEQLKALFGKSGGWFYRAARGEDDRAVNPSSERKSLSVEDTFTIDLLEQEDLERELRRLCFKLSERLSKHQLLGKSLTLKVTYSDFTKVTRSATFIQHLVDPEDVLSKAVELLKKTKAGQQPVRLLGVGVSSFKGEELELEFPLQMEFWE